MAIDFEQLNEAYSDAARVIERWADAIIRMGRIGTPGASMPPLLPLTHGIQLIREAEIKEQQMAMETDANQSPGHIATTWWHQPCSYTHNKCVI